jgi:hypothetical protein
MVRHMGEASPPSSAEPGADLLAGPQRTTAKRSGSIALAVGALVAVGAVIAVVLLVSGPRSDATMQPTGVVPDDQLRALMQSEGADIGFSPRPGYGSEMEIDLSTLAAFGSYQGFEIWSAANAFESACLIAVHRETVDIVARACVPTGADLFIDTIAHGLPEGEILRFFLRADTVEVFHLTPDGTG